VNIRLRNSPHRTSILPGKVSDISRLLLSYIQLFLQVFVPQIMNAITDLHAIVYRSSPSLPVKHPCAETYHRTGLRRVLHRVFCLRSHRLHTMTGGVYEPLSDYIARSYPITTLQFIITGGLITRLWLSEVARCTQRGFFEATAADCDDLDTTSCQHGMNGDHIDEDNCK
jgi:hypothetical protein